MQSNRRDGRAAALWAAFAILLLVFVTEIFTERALDAHRSAITRMYDVIRSLQELRTNVADAILARRALSLASAPERSGAERTLDSATLAARRDLVRLQGLTVGDVSLDQLSREAEALLAGLQRPTPRSEAPFDLASERAAAAADRAAYRTVAGRLSALHDAEQSTLAARRSAARSISSRARAAEAMGVVISACLLLYVFRKLRREIRLREHSERALRESESRMATTLDSIGDGVIVTDADGRVIRMNPVAERLTGLALDQARDRSFASVFPAIDERTREPAEDPVLRALKIGEVVALGSHTALRCSDGVERPIAESAAPIRDASGKVAGAVMVFHDRSEERAAERRVHAANVFLDSIVENLPNMLFVKEANELRFMRLNKAGEDLLGSPRAAMLGKNDFDFFPPEQAQFFQQKDRDVLSGRHLIDIPVEPIQTPAGMRWLHTKKIPILDDNGEPLYLLGISEDVTEKQAIAEELLRAKAELEQRVEDRTRDLRAANEELKREVFERRQAQEALQRSEQQLRQAQKMEAIGRLAGGVAHDFNNLLSVILSYSQLVLRALPRESPMRTEIEQISRAGMRAADLTRQLLAFSRQQLLMPKIVDLNSSLDSMHRMLRRLIGEDIELRTLPAQALGRVRVDPGQIEQVIVNLAINSRDAMPSGGMLTIETGNVDLDAAYAADHPGVNPGPHVMLAVSDTGSGMDRETQARIFEPFFTTKEQGKGTGLGLSTVFGIVQQSGGSIWVYSEPNQGSTFKIYLPRIDGLDSHQSSSSFQRVVLSGTETVLLVEDDEQVRALAKTVLERNGFRVIAASGCEEALQVEAAYAEPIQLLLTDVVMPRMSGRQLAEQLSRQRPRMKVLFMSGYTDDTVVHHGVLDAGIQFLQKPLTPEGLTRKVREVLDNV